MRNVIFKKNDETISISNPAYDSWTIRGDDEDNNNETLKSQEKIY